MIIIINTSNLYVGGGLQVAISFINELNLLKLKHTYHIFLSKAVSKQIDQSIFSENFIFYLIEHSPASLKYRRRVLKQMCYLERDIQPDIVFSVFGITYWKPNTTHIMGFALGWLVNPKSLAFNLFDFKKRIRLKLNILYKSFFLKNSADYYITETEDAKIKLSIIKKIQKKNIFVVGNTYSRHFDSLVNKVIEIPESHSSEFKFITICHNFPHKNLKIIKEIIPFLLKQKKPFKFILTIDQASYESLFAGLTDYVTTLGTINVDLCPSLYQQCDALFLPSLLECFSASYPEAMKMNKPILTSDLSFAHDICQDSAIYFDPLDPKNISEKIIKLMNNKELQNSLIKKGQQRLSQFETAHSRAKKYIKICEKIHKNKI